MKFDYEKTLQTLIEKNLGDFFADLDFLESEYTVKNFRMDTIAYDNGRKSFVIIEYKNDKSKSIIDQGFTYYDILQNNPAEFVLLYNKIKKSHITKNDINWDDIRLIFISQHFNDYQIHAGNFKGLPLELYTVQKYSNDIVTLDRLTNNINKIKNHGKITPLGNDVVEYSESEYLDGVYDTSIPSPKIKDLYFQLKDLILSNFDKDEFKQRKRYVGFYLITDNSVIYYIQIGKNQIKVIFYSKTEKLFIKNLLVEDLSNKGHWGHCNLCMKIKNKDDMLKAFDILKLTYIDKTGFLSQDIE